MKNSLIIIIAVIVIIVVGIVCYSVGFDAGEKSLEEKAAQYKKIIDYNNPMAGEIFTISGKITKIQGNALSIETTIYDPYKLPEEQKPEIRKVIIDEETKIVKIEIPEDPMEEPRQTELTLGDLKVGDQISAGANENIKDKTEFIAQSINLSVTPEMPEEIPSPETE